MLNPIVPEKGVHLQEAGAEPAYRESPQMGHSIDPGFLEDLRAWLGSVLGRGAS